MYYKKYMYRWQRRIQRQFMNWLKYSRRYIVSIPITDLAITVSLSYVKHSQLYDVGFKLRICNISRYKEMNSNV